MARGRQANFACFVVVLSFLPILLISLFLFIFIFTKINDFDIMSRAKASWQGHVGEGER